MPRHFATLALITVLGGTPLLGAAPASAAPEQPATVAEPAPSDRTSESTSPLLASPRAELGTPAAPIPLNLPDNATNEEVEGAYGIGIASLIIGTLFVTALVVGAFYILARRSWSTSH
jgi:hypothetical protein